MKGKAEFRATWHVSAARRQSRPRTSLSGKHLLLAALVAALGMLARPAPALRFGPAPQFEGLPVGHQGTPHFVALHNSGWGPLEIRAIRLTGDAPGDFVPVTSDCASRLLAPGRVCIVTLSFAPQGTGRRNAQLSVIAEGVSFSASLPLMGSAYARDDFQVIPPGIEFGDQAVGNPSDWHSAEIRSTAARPLQIMGVRLAGATAEDFEQGSNTCSAALPVGGQCSLAVRFAPRVPGERSARLILTDSSGDASHEIALSGRGTAADLSLDPELVSFPGIPLGQRSAAASVLVRSSGSSNAHIDTILPGGEAPDNFILSQNSCESVTLPSGASCSLTVLFQPTTVGLRTATLTLSDNSLDGPHVIHLEGTGTDRPRPSAQILARTFSFGGQAINTTSNPLPIAVLSRGTVPLTIGTVHFTGGQSSEFRFKTNCTRHALRPNDHCEVDVYFLPTKAGKFDAQISIPHDALDAPRVVNVYGEGLVPEVGWCCIGGRVIETDARACTISEGRYFLDFATARKACAPATSPPKPTPPETPTGLEPGVTSRAQSPPVACDALALNWNSTVAPGGYFVWLARLSSPGTEIAVAPKVLYANPVSTNQFRIPTALEAGSYQWTVASLGVSGERSSPAPFRYFRCNPRVSIPSRVTALSPTVLKGRQPASPPIR